MVLEYQKKYTVLGLGGCLFCSLFFCLFLNKSIHLSHLLPKIFQNQSCSGFNIPTTPANRNIPAAEQPPIAPELVFGFICSGSSRPDFHHGTRGVGGPAPARQGGGGPPRGAAPPRACSRDHSREVGERSRRRSAAQANER